MEQYYEGGLIKDGRPGVIYEILKHLQSVKSESIWMNEWICSEWMNESIQNEQLIK